MRPWSERVFSLLLRLQPRDVRDRFGDEMRAHFAARRGSVHGPVASLAFWLDTLADAITSGWRARRPPRLAAPPKPPAGLIAVDLRIAVRRLRRVPGRSLALITLVALTVGATLAVWAVADAVLLTPPSYADSDRVVAIWERREPGGARNVVGAHEFPVWSSRTTTLDHLAALIHADANLTGAGDPLALAGVRTTSEFFDVFAVEFTVGRGFRADEDVPGAPRVVVISHRLWRERFAGDPAVVGRSIAIDAQPTAIIGVAPEGFTFPSGQAGRPPDIWMPIAEPIHLYRGRHYLRVVGRLGPGQGVEAAESDLSAIAESLAAELPDHNRGHGVLVAPLFDDLVDGSRPALTTLLASVGILALVGIVNIAGLSSASAHRRRTDHQICLALGAGRARIARQLAIESATLGAIGGGIGCLAASWLTRVVPALVPAGVLPTTTIAVTPAVLAAGAALAAVCAVAAWGAAVVALPRLTTGGIGGAARVTGGHPVARSVLVVAQVALTFALLASSTLVLAQWRALERIDVGFDPAGVMTFDLALPTARYADGPRQRQFFEQLSEKVRESPGVEFAATSSLLPLGGGRSTVAIAIEGRPALPAGQQPTVSYRAVGTDYFRLLGIRVTSGRAFDQGDARLALPLIRWYAGQPEPPEATRAQAAPVAVIDQTMAEKFWPGEDAVGRRFRVLFSDWITVVGVVGPAQNWTREANLTPELYLSDLQEPVARTNLLVRTSGSPESIVPLVRRAVRDLDAGLPIMSAARLDDITATELGLPRLTSALSGGFSLAAVALTATGVYALLSLMTTARTREIGIRVALGATRTSVRWLILRQSVGLAAAGLALGIFAWRGLAELLDRQVPGLFADVTVGHGNFASVETLVAATIVAVTMVVASAVPVRRALGIDPAVALKGDGGAFRGSGG